MFIIESAGDGRYALGGRLTAAHIDEVGELLDRQEATCILDFAELTYISSAGLSHLINTQHRLQSSGHELKLINLSDHLQDLFRVAGLDMIFTLE